MKHLIKRHYEATVKRGLINDLTTDAEFMDKLQEEFGEVLESYTSEGLTPDTIHECMDLVMVVFNLMSHYGMDIETILRRNVEYQESRI